MHKLSLLLSIQNSSLRQAILNNPELAQFNTIQLEASQDWISEIKTIAPTVAIIGVNNFSSEDYQALSKLEALNEMDLIIISSGAPNPNLDKLMQLGAIFHYRMPVDIEILAETLQDVRQSNLPKSTVGQQVSTSDLDQFGLLIGSSSPMHRLYRTLRRVAKTDASVFVIGESGAGKELVAQTIHQASDRSQYPFIAINCGAISPDLVDSELFGHNKGAFTGADKPHDGVFKRAEGGTLFLDEITEMPIEHQVKLLRVLETGEYRRVGGETVHIANTRIIAATNRDPQTAIDEQELREDLYFRLAHFPINVPPLRERGSDIVGLAKHFIAHQNAKEVKTKTILEAALDKIAAYDWPGNVRELKHSIERAFILSDDVIKEEHIVSDSLQVTGEDSTLNALVPVGVALVAIEKAAIVNTLDNNEGNKTKTAQELGISVKTLYNKLDKYEVT
ncbi:sigma-54 dependent transcriptional regulator [Psychromonas sp. SP041]|uniref:sigma-54 interaction domain-containing protein n=1 Tax=Psychromonas sp. SP041 TaxID=1365007 RepID=UPI00041E2A39|nr:sigma-54 dependent transcriptional regulator [Psychromonas sp. SP041]